MTLVLSLLVAIPVLFAGATVLWFASEMISGKREFILHFGNVTLVTVVGVILFPFWGWTSTGIVLAASGGIWIASGILDRLRG